MATKMMVSKHIEDFVRFYNQANSLYTYCRNQMKSCDEYTQDLLHKLELEELTSSEKGKIATQLKYIRKDRRYYKDRVEELEPFVQLFDSNDKSRGNEAVAFKRMMNCIQNSLGAVRKQEEYHSSRTYRPRILKVEEDG